MLTLIGLIAAFCTTIALVPQVIKSLKTKKTGDVSLLMYILFSIGCLLWMIYGLKINSQPLYLANGISFTLSLIVLTLKVKNG